MKTQTKAEKRDSKIRMAILVCFIVLSEVPYEVWKEVHRIIFYTLIGQIASTIVLGIFVVKLFWRLLTNE